MKSQVTIRDNEVEIIRIFDAPRERVFQAWTVPEQVQQWWGCRQTTKVESEMDFREGGAFTHTMHIEGAGVLPCSGIYEEISEPEKIVYSLDFGEMKATVSVRFLEEQGSKTKLILTQNGFPAPDLCEIVSEGFIASFNKLDRLLGQNRNVA